MRILGIVGFAVIVFLAVIHFCYQKSFNTKDIIDTLPGEYISNDKYNGVIIIKKDATYIHQLIVRGKSIQYRATWWLDKSNSRDSLGLVFDNFQYFKDDFFYNEEEKSEAYKAFSIKEGASTYVLTKPGSWYAYENYKLFTSNISELCYDSERIGPCFKKK